MFTKGYDVNHDVPVTVTAKTLLQIGVAIHLVLEDMAASDQYTEHSEELYDAQGLIEVALLNAGAVIGTNAHEGIEFVTGRGNQEHT